MNLIGLIPSRMDSTRLPGKALADILGLPMVVRVWQAASESGVFQQVLVATDSDRIASVCKEYEIPFLMTSRRHTNPTSRIAEAASLLKGSYYVMIGGDEPLLSPSDIRQVVEKGVAAIEAGSFAANAIAPIRSLEEALDPSNIKVVCDARGRGLYASRSPIPHHREASVLSYRKFVSIGVYTREALDFFTSTPPGVLELTEEFDLLRFLEHGKPVDFIEIEGRTLSVDTPADLEKVRHILREQAIKQRQSRPQNG